MLQRLLAERFALAVHVEAPMPPPSECGGSREPGRVWMRGVTIPNFARAILVGWTDRSIEDRTGLSGGDDLDLEFVPGSGAAPGTSSAGGDSASLFTALEEQLGLKLRPGRKVVDVLVIDRLDLPTENCARAGGFSICWRREG